MSTEPQTGQRPTIREWDVLLVEPDQETFCALRDGCLTGLRVLHARTAQEGDEKIRRLNFRLVICADELPDTPGLMLMAQTMQLWPATQRILMCNDLDKGLLIHTLREGSIVRYLPKPIDPEAAANLVGHALEENRMMERLFMTRQLLDKAQAQLAERSPAAGVVGELERGGSKLLLWLTFATLVVIVLVLVGFAAFYLFKSSVGIDFFPDSHLQDLVEP